MVWVKCQVHARPNKRVSDASKLRACTDIQKMGLADTPTLNVLLKMCPEDNAEGCTLIRVIVERNSK